jgi:hypothetical protein
MNVEQSEKASLIIVNILILRVLNLECCLRDEIL